MNINTYNRINKIKNLNKANYYLEIGVQSGDTFLNVDILFKDAVDPEFSFDTFSYTTDYVRFFKTESDNFWTSNNPRVYDIIFIDGLHKFEQTCRDLVSSLAYSHPKTIWLIDDTLPSDAFSAIPDIRKSYLERSKHGLGGSPWHGDVFKVVPFIHDFMPNVCYATCINDGNPQTIMWRSGRSNFVPAFNNFEAISRFSYFDINENAKIFNFLPQETILDMLEQFCKT